MINFTKNLQWKRGFVIRFLLENLFLYIKVIGIDHVMTNDDEFHNCHLGNKF